MSRHHRVPPGRAIVLLPLLLAGNLIAASPDRAPVNAHARPAPGSVINAIPVTAEHYYRVAGRVRPLLLFWIGRDDVGAARITWRSDEQGARAFELLAGSDPARAPRHLNRWGYVAERTDPSGAWLLGIMKGSAETSLDEAKANVEREGLPGARAFTFKAIRSTVGRRTARAEIQTISSPRDFTFLDAASLLQLIQQGAGTSKSNELTLPEGVQPGFLVTMADAVHRSVLAHRRAPGGRLDHRPVTYTYNGRLYDLVLRGSKFLSQLRAGDSAFSNVLQSEFDVRNRETRRSTRFELAYGVDGALAEVPVRIAYQPNWWIELELVLDDSKASDSW